MTSGVRGSSNLTSFTCEYCKQSFERCVYPSSFSDGMQFRFCSPSCRNKGRIKPPRYCKNCNKQLIYGQKKYCSNECSAIASKGKKRVNVARQPIIDTIISLYPNTSAKTLSQLLKLSESAIENIAYKQGLKHTEHYMKQYVYKPNSERMKRNNPAVGRPRLKHKDYYRGSNWHKQREKALERDGYRCQICKKKVGKRSRDYGVHHITPYREYGSDYERANRLSNLITLCRHCHPLVEHGYLPCPLPLPYDL